MWGATQKLFKAAGERIKKSVVAYLASETANHTIAYSAPGANTSP